MKWANKEKIQVAMPGISEKDWNKIFKPFKPLTAEEHRKRPPKPKKGGESVRLTDLSDTDVKIIKEKVKIIESGQKDDSE